jgi:hypothetical protein
MLQKSLKIVLNVNVMSVIASWLVPMAEKCYENLWAGIKVKIKFVTLVY